MASGYRRPAPRVPSGPPRLTPGSFRHATSVTPERAPAARATSSPELLTSPEYQRLVPFIFSITRLHLSSHALRPALCAPSSGWFVEALRECELLHTSASTLQDLRQLSWLKPFIQLDPSAFSGRTVEVAEYRRDHTSLGNSPSPGGLHYPLEQVHHVIIQNPLCHLLKHDVMSYLVKVPS